MRDFQQLQICCLIVLLSLVFASQAKVVSNSEYCEIGPCYNQNLPCNYKGKVKRCFSHAKLLNEVDYRYLLQDLFNTLRNNVAGGKTYRNLPTAARMGRMIWNTELAYFAKLDVSRCEIKSRPCLSSNKFALIGSLADRSNYLANNTASSLRKAIKDIASGWFEAIPSITRLDTLHLKVTDNDSGILPACLLIIEYNTKFGCAVLRYMRNSNYFIILSCVFSTDNQDNQTIYKWGVSPGVQCRKRDKKYSNLCDKEEKYEEKKPKTYYPRMGKL